MNWIAWDTTKNKEACRPIPNGIIVQDVALEYVNENPESTVIVGYVMRKPEKKPEDSQSVTISKEIGNQELFDIFVTAMEGGK